MAILTEIIEKLNPLRIIGNTEKNVINAIQLDADNQRDDVLMWVSPKFSDRLKNVSKGIILCGEFPEEYISEGCTYLLFENPRLAFQKALTEFFMPAKNLGELDMLSIETDELWPLIRSLLKEIQPQHYKGSKPPQKAYEN